jgi:hypothetical protein
MPSDAWFAEVLRGDILAPVTVDLGDGRLVSVTSLLRSEQRSTGEIPEARSCWAPNKVAIDFEGTPSWEEFAIVRLLEREGWWACWVKFWYGTREFCQRPGTPVQMPAEARSAFARIERATAGAGVWDVFAWKDGPLFIESKQYRSSDRINANQTAWLGAAVDAGFDASRFAIVNYDAGRPAAVSSASAAPPNVGALPLVDVPSALSATKRSRAGGVLDEARTGRPPRSVGACSGINRDGSRCRNPGRYDLNGKLSCSRMHASYR